MSASREMKVGDIVVVDPELHTGIPFVCDGMLKYRGMAMRISKADEWVNHEEAVRLNLLDSGEAVLGYFWTEKMLILCNKYDLDSDDDIEDSDLSIGYLMEE